MFTVQYLQWWLLISTVVVMQSIIPAAHKLEAEYKNIYPTKA